MRVIAQHASTCGAMRHPNCFEILKGFHMQRTLLTLTLVLFGALTAVALWQHGYLGLLAGQIETWGGVQVLVDLVIAVTLVLVWMWRDAQASGRNVWPWVVLTLVAGSFGPLGYLLTRQPHVGNQHDGTPRSGF